MRAHLQAEAQRKYGVDAIVTRYMEAVEEIINIPRLVEVFEGLVRTRKLQQIVDEIVPQSRVEFNVDDDEDDEASGAE